MLYNVNYGNFGTLIKVDIDKPQISLFTMVSLKHISQHYTIKKLIITTSPSKGGFQIMNDLIDIIAEIEHEQWMTWSKELAQKEKLSPKRLARWEKLWIPYAELPDDMKEFDRKWARDVITAVLEDVIIETDGKGNARINQWIISKERKLYPRISKGD